MSASAPPSSSPDPADVPLRRDVRRLGVGASRREEPRPTVAGLEPERQALVLRAFGVYFQLPLHAMALGKAVLAYLEEGVRAVLSEPSPS